MIRAHLGLVFKHEIDPSYDGPEKQAVLDSIHHSGGLSGRPSSDVKYRC
jgi:hypothetical protein